MHRDDPEAGEQIRAPLQNDITPLSTQQCVRARCAIAPLFPGLHPDGYEHPDSGWPRGLKRFAAGAWRRADAGEPAAAKSHPGDAAWRGIYNCMFSLSAEETQRRLALAADCGASLNA